MLSSLSKLLVPFHYQVSDNQTELFSSRIFVSDSVAEYRAAAEEREEKNRFRQDRKLTQTLVSQTTFQSRTRHLERKSIRFHGPPMNSSKLAWRFTETSSSLSNNPRYPERMRIWIQERQNKKCRFYCRFFHSILFFSINIVGMLCSLCPGLC